MAAGGVSDWQLRCSIVFLVCVCPFLLPKNQIQFDIGVSARLGARPELPPAPRNPKLLSEIYKFLPLPCTFSLNVWRARKLHMMSS